jgi:hypothetical protein
MFALAGYNSLGNISDAPFGWRGRFFMVCFGCRIEHSVPTRNGYCQNLGDYYETTVSPRLFHQIGWRHEAASPEQNWKNKFDFFISAPNGQSFKLEVKAPKKPANCLLFEATGISGYKGWGRGDADYILQWLNQNSALFYSRAKMLKTCISIGGTIPVSPPRFDSGMFAPCGTWQGRSGLSTRSGKVNQDCFMLLTPSQARLANYQKLRLQ